MEKFTVIGMWEDNGGQVVAHHVMAVNGNLAIRRQQLLCPGMTVIAAVKGHLTDKEGALFFPDDTSEVLPGATAQEIQDVMMQDIVGDYETPDQVPEWAWVERVASYGHAQNGVSGVWEFVLNLNNTWDDIPEKLLPVIQEARNNNMSYLLIHQGT